jgi:hypothetical protein
MFRTLIICFFLLSTSVQAMVHSNPRHLHKLPGAGADDVAKAYVKAYLNNDISVLVSLTGRDHSPLYLLLENKTIFMPLLRTVSSYRVELSAEDGNSAVVMLQATYEGEPQELLFVLAREEGNWVIHSF